ncbi:corrinoid protein [Marinisporobacter balticus]|uniref:Methylmalonyl-CoA mutase cobalamin-binding domain/chain/corrinoid protein of di/trimethylamine methyltransferase n=1 Tax=Marinisporobacter balticus TaxID=2018667 RepID=A0A4R2KPC5_9FIRM|nr:corrinoid protein [Marinisporobacter balticus]TCO72699.1 methylmalonyl-CoA mutase cobalamin-binding domain/chain/corrinoid protein of di/trimethylamine methyltransferase [Marinisporobacter balticus]
MRDLKKSLLQDLANCVVEMEEERVQEVASRYIENKFDALEGINEGLAKGMEQAGQLYEEEEYYIPELLMCSDSMYTGLDTLKPHIVRSEESEKYKAVIGVVEGDTHDIGKNLVKIMMETAGFDVIDLGRDIAPRDFVEKAKEIGAQIICLSTLMTTTMVGMEEVIKILKKENIRDQFKVMVGGGPISQNFADKIGADAYTNSAGEAAKVAKELAWEGTQC